LPTHVPADLSQAARGTRPDQPGACAGHVRGALLPPGGHGTGAGPRGISSRGASSC